MNTILQKRIEESAKKYCQDKNYILPDDTELSLEALTAIDAYIEGAKSILQNQWISVEEALPIIGKDGYVDVFIIIKKNKKTLTYTARFEDNKFWNIDGFCVYQGFTHWMEIPSLKGGEE